MGRTACTEPQCLYKGDLYLYLYLILSYLTVYTVTLAGFFTIALSLNTGAMYLKLSGKTASEIK